MRVERDSGQKVDALNAEKILAEKAELLFVALYVRSFIAAITAKRELSGK